MRKRWREGGEEVVAGRSWEADGGELMRHHTKNTLMSRRKRHWESEVERERERERESGRTSEGERDEYLWTF